MEDTRLMVCDRCRKSVPISHIKYMPKGDSMVSLCNECRSENAPKKEDASVKKLEKKKYICLRCRYKFDYVNDGITNFKCPYCGKSDKITDNNPTSADNIIKAVAKE